MISLDFPLLFIGFPLIFIGFPLISIEKSSKIIDFQHILKYELEYKTDFEIDLTFRLMTRKNISHMLYRCQSIIGIDSAHLEGPQINRKKVIPAGVSGNKKNHRSVQT